MIEIGAQSCVYLDTNVFIYFFEGDADYSGRAIDLMARLRATGAKVLTSELTIAECLYKPCRDGQHDRADRYERAFEAGWIELIPVDGGLIRRAARDGGSLRLKLLDAIHYLAALEAGCDVFVSSDRRFRSGPLMDVMGI